jgi:hypothetical protein
VDVSSPRAASAPFLSYNFMNMQQCKMMKSTDLFYHIFTFIDVKV